VVNMSGRGDSGSSIQICGPTRCQTVACACANYSMGAPSEGRRFSVVEPAFKAGAHAYSLSVVHWFGL
jgi:hypothetical protein